MNWEELLADLIKSGLTQAQIAESAGCTQAFISNLFTGTKKSCDYEIGVRLVRMRDELNQKQAA